MITPPLPVDEAGRLAALRGLNILDTPPEERFDRVTRLCRRIFKTSYAVVSLVDADRQWFKSAQGGLDAKETSRDVSFCAHAILRDELMVVPDALLDPRFAGNPLVVKAPHIRFYAGMPLSGAGGRKLGTLCVMDTQPRGLGADDAEILKDLAAVVEDELGNLELNAAVSRLQESESTLADFMDNVGDLIMIVSVEGSDSSKDRIIYANRAWKERLGYDDKDLQNLRIGDISRPEDSERREEILRRLRAGESLRGLQVDLVAKDGRSFPVEATTNLRFKDGKPYYGRVILRDITERRKIEQLKNEAVSLASHELRQPLAVIGTALEALETHGPTMPAAKAREFLQMARRNAARLLDMVNLYLDLAKLESGSLELKPEPVPLAPLIARVVKDAEIAAAPRGVRLALSGPEDDVSVMADPGRLVQVVVNLLSNAVKFSPPGETVTVSWARQGEEAGVAVADHGPGISPEFRSRIFGKFAQDRSIEASRDIKGTGLGLSIAKAIIEKSGGRIGFETEAGKGTTFRFSLPRAPSKADIP